MSHLRTIFLGVNPQAARNVVAEYVESGSWTTFVQPFCGRFGLSEVIAKITEKPGNIWASDICVFSAAVGRYLADQGVEELGDFDSKPVTLVLLKKPSETGPKDVYNPQRKKSLLERMTQGIWSSEEEQFLIELYNSGLKVTDIFTRLQKTFPNRTLTAVKKRIVVLQKSGKIKKRYKKVGEPQLHRRGRPRESEETSQPVGVRTPMAKAEKPEGQTSGLGPLEIWQEYARLAKITYQAVDLLKEIHRLLKPKQFTFEHHCRACKDSGTAEDSQVWRYCPVCGRELIVWDVHEEGLIETA